MASVLPASPEYGRTDDCLVVTPTWAENHRLTQAIRNQLKDRRLLKDGTSLTVHDPLEWTTQQKAKAANFSPGMIVQFHADAGKTRRGQSFVVESVKDGRLLCVVILYGRELRTVFEDAVKQELGEVREGGVPDNCPDTGLWIDSLQIIDPPGSVEDQAFDDYVRKRGEHLASESELEGTNIA